MADSRSALDQLFDEAPSGTSGGSGSGGGSGRRGEGRGGDGRRGEPRKRRGLRNTVIVLVSLIALLGIAAGVAYLLIANTYNEVKRVSIEQDPSLERPAETVVDDGAKAPINILLLGSDSREATDRNASVEDLTGFRSDAIMVAQISPDRQHATIMSIMRDNWVPIQGVGEAKINAAFSYGGLPLAVNTVENYIGARIDHVAVIDFESFKGLTDAVGGVTVNNTVPFTAQNGGGGFTFEGGEITLDGEHALSFVRERYAFSDGDYQRARNQQAYMKGLLQKTISSETMSDPSRMVSMFQSLKPYLILDEGLDLNRFVNLGLESRKLRSDDIAFFTSPTLGTGTSADGQSIVIPDEAGMEAIRTAFHDGTIHELAPTLAAG
ncbi:LCP family protein [Leucobacter sp. CSA1]|uniref:LCP family protein n=1 Tax=Leucobacter chromiisoli TaxID=2796471 RepID=A0A934Q981_9MICO|nr:LCP family protein [Leucobacter chromiisoli]MBK0419461.1 LCP family protein [Leucobacter chromiisoli]